MSAITIYHSESIENISKHGVYKIWHNMWPRRVYIGSAGSIRKTGTRTQGFLLRWNIHLSDLKTNTHPSRKLQEIVNECGISGIRFCILEILPPIKKILYEREQYWMDIYKAASIGCNTHPLANSPIGRPINKEEDRYSKSVVQYDKNGNFIKEFISARKANRETGILYKIISRTCLGQVIAAGGYVWRFKGDSFNKFRTIPMIDVSIKQISQYDLNGIFIKKWNSISEAGRALKTSIGNISMNIHGFRNNAGGFIWKLNKG